MSAACNVIFFNIESSLALRAEPACPLSGDLDENSVKLVSLE